MTAGYLPKPKGRPRKKAIDETTRVQNELKELRMQVDTIGEKGKKSRTKANG